MSLLQQARSLSVRAGVNSIIVGAVGVVPVLEERARLSGFDPDDADAGALGHGDRLVGRDVPRLRLPVGEPAHRDCLAEVVPERLGTRRVQDELVRLVRVCHPPCGDADGVLGVVQPLTLASAAMDWVEQRLSLRGERAHVQLDGARHVLDVWQVRQGPQQGRVVRRVEPDGRVDDTVEDEELRHVRAGDEVGKRGFGAAGGGDRTHGQAPRAPTSSTTESR